MKNLFSQIYFSGKLFAVLGAIVMLFIFSYSFSWLFPLAKALLFATVVITIVDGFFLFSPQSKLLCTRKIPYKLLSLGDKNKIMIAIENRSDTKFHLQLIDEVPYQLQMRNFSYNFFLEKGEKEEITYWIKPTKRGEYEFHNLIILATATLGLLRRRFVFPQYQKIAVYPSIIQMKEFELMAFSSTSRYSGIKKIRKLGHNYEFEQIKNYVRGDDYRSINWKASARKAEIMVNQYQDERSQQIYSIIDRSRSMRLPFGGLSLMDHAINTSLVISNIAIQKQDKAGLLTYADKLGTLVRADRKKNQLELILNSLYKQNEQNLEANFELLFLAIRNLIKGRSLLFLYTNFESIYALERALPILRRINKYHLLVTIFFENHEIVAYAQEDAKTLEDVYLKTIALKFATEKKQMLQLLSQYGIQTILTKPEDLSLNTVNKYLELKSRGMI